MKTLKIASKILLIFLFIILAISTGHCADSQSEDDFQLIEKPGRKSGDALILRRKRTVKFQDLPLSIRKRLVENLNTIRDYEDDAEDDDEDTENDFEEKNISKREIDSENNEEDTFDDERTKRDDKTTKDLELAQSELKKVEKNVETEILNLKKRSKNKFLPSNSFNNDLKRQIEKSMLTTPDEQPRLLKIEVETVDFDNDKDENKNNQNINSEKSKKDLTKSDECLQRRQTSEVQDKNLNLNSIDIEIENKIKKKIDLIKELVKRELEERKKIKEIELNNEKFDKIQGINKKATETDDYENTRKKRRIKNKRTKESVPEKAQVKIEDKLLPDAEVDPRLGFNEAKKYSRSSRDAGESSRVNPKEKNSQQTGSNNNEPQNFLFPGQLDRQRKRRMPFHHRKFKKKSPKNAHGRRAKHKKKNQRIERAADEGLNAVGSDSVAESNGPVDVSNSQDISPQFVPEYQEAFGGLPSDTGSAFMRYKRIKRDKY